MQDANSKSGGASSHESKEIAMNKSSLKRRIVSLAMALSITALAFGPGGAFGAEKDRIQIGWQPAVGYGMYVAQILKLYEQEGLSPEHLKFESGPAMFAALGTGDIDVAYMSVFPAIFGLAHGLDIKIFLMPEESSRGSGLIVRRDSGIKSIADQKAKRIAATFGSWAHYQVIASLKKAGLAETDLTILDMTPPVKQAAFIRGDIDGVWFWEPWLVRLQREGGVVVATSRDVGNSVPVVWVARTAFLRDRPQTVQKFLRAYDRAVQTKLTGEIADRIGNIVGLPGDLTIKALAGFEVLQMNQQLSGHLISMGTSETKTQTSLYRQIGEFAEFLFQRKRITQIPDIAKAIDPGPVEQYLRKK